MTPGGSEPGSVPAEGRVWPLSGRGNVVNTLNLLDSCRRHGIQRFVFSSTCATYGIPSEMPIVETLPQAPINPYGQTKLAIEQALARRTVEIDRFFFDWRGGALRDPPARSLPYKGEEFADFRGLIAACAAAPGALDHPYWSDEAPQSMHIEEVEAIWSAIDEADDWAPLHAKVAAVRRMGEAMHGGADRLKIPPLRS